MLVAWLLVAFTVGMLVGVVLGARATPRMIARLPAAERLEFARKVNRLARR